MVDAIRDSLGGDLSEPRTITRNGVDHQCSAASLGSLCSYQDGAISVSASAATATSTGRAGSPTRPAAASAADLLACRGGRG
ncbi:MAG TPA: hypothetical protein VFA45_05455 [Actinomycetes bacterium]|nr:hypothetical protein [Actinomycetes bacterium]